MDLTTQATILRQLSRTDPDPRVRHRADGLYMVAIGHTVTEAAQALGCSRRSVHRWGQRLLAAGREGLVDRPRQGRPRTLDGQACKRLEAALAGSPLDQGYPVTTWTVADLTDLLARQGWEIQPATVYRTRRRLGYRYRRPRHDLHHRQDAEAVMVAKHALAELQKRGRLPRLASERSTWMSVTSIPNPTWRKLGNGRDCG